MYYRAAADGEPWASTVKMAFAYKIDASAYRPSRTTPPRERRVRQVRAAELFILFEIVCQLALLVSAFSSLRQLMRAAAFAASLVMVPLFGIRDRRHPASIAAILIFMIIGLSVFNPTRNSWSSACAQFVLYLAILAPLFWVPSLRLDDGAWYRVLFILWIFHSLSAATGVLQVCFPGHFSPSLSSAVSGHGWNYVKDLMITTNSRERVFRPMGLTDVPGGAAYGGLYAVSIGLLFFVRDRRNSFRILSAGSMAVGLAAIALSQVRTVLLMTAICVLTFFVLLQVRNVLRSGQRARSGERIGKINIVLAAVAIAMVIVLGSAIALSLATKSVSDRVTSLVSEDPGQIYYKSRGNFLEKTVNEILPRYPFGAGPGRWGMMYAYFGDPQNLENPPIWAEIQWTGWVLDGGAPLVIAYVLAILLAFQFSLKTALGRNARDVGLFGAFVFAYNVGAFAQTFDSPFFITQDGMVFWFMNALLFATALGWSYRAPT